MSNVTPPRSNARPLSKFRVHGNTVYVSGQVPVLNGSVVEGGLEAQTRQTLENVRAAVVAAGSSTAQILKCSCYLRHEKDLGEFNRVYAEFFGDGPFPARTTLIASPPNPAVLIEIEAIAAL